MKITLTDLVNLQNETTAVNAINANNAAVETAMENTLSRDGTSPNTMGSNLDMNNNQILNLSAPVSVSSPVRLQDVTTAPIISSVPPVGTSGATVPLLNANNTFSGTNTFSAANTFSGVATLVAPVIGTPASGTLTNCTGLPVATGISGLAAGVSTFLATPSSANFLSAVTDETGTGSIVFSTSPTLVTPSLGVATGTSIGVTSSLGYVAGGGGTVTQATNKATAVTLNKSCGAITLNNAALAAGTVVSFTLNNSTIAATDVLVLNHISGGTPGSYTLNAQAGLGLAVINIRNNTAGSLSEAVVIQFAVIKAVNT